MPEQMSKEFFDEIMGIAPEQFRRHVRYAMQFVEGFFSAREAGDKPTDAELEDIFLIVALYCYATHNKNAAYGGFVQRARRIAKWAAIIVEEKAEKAEPLDSSSPEAAVNRIEAMGERLARMMWHNEAFVLLLVELKTGGESTFLTSLNANAHIRVVEKHLDEMKRARAMEDADA